MKQVALRIKSAENHAEIIITNEKAASFEIIKLIDELVNIRVYLSTPKDLYGVA